MRCSFLLVFVLFALAAARIPDSEVFKHQSVRACTLTDTCVPPVTKAGRLVEWLSDNRVVLFNTSFVSAKALVSGNGTLGMLATGNITEGDRLICVPVEAMVSVETIMESDLAPVLLDCGYSPEDWSQPPSHEREYRVGADQMFSLFVARMLYDRDYETSSVGDRFGAYFDSWPSGDELPPNWSAADRALIAMPLITIDFEYDNMYKHVISKHPEVFGNPPRPAYSSSNMTRALSLLRSRFVPTNWTVHQMTSHFDISKIHLIPGMDSMNQGPQEAFHMRFNRSRRFNVIRNQETDNVEGICIEAGRNYSHREEIFNFYGDTLLPSFFPTYGFLHDNAASDAYVFMVKGADVMIDPALVRGHFAADISVINPSDRSQNLFVVPIGTKSAPIESFLPWARMYAFHRQYPNIEQSKRDEFTKQAFAGPVMTTLERMARREIQSRLESAESLGPIGDIEDEKDYFKANEAKMTANQKMAAMYRLRIKAVIEREYRRFIGATKNQ